VAAALRVIGHFTGPGPSPDRPLLCRSFYGAHEGSSSTAGAVRGTARGRTLRHASCETLRTPTALVPTFPNGAETLYGRERCLAPEPRVGFRTWPYVAVRTSPHARTQNPVWATTCGFKSHLRHFEKRVGRGFPRYQRSLWAIGGPLEGVQPRVGQLPTPRTATRSCSTGSTSRWGRRPVRKFSLPSVALWSGGGYHLSSITFRRLS
jgi:hypothetical protein